MNDQATIWVIDFQDGDPIVAHSLETVEYWKKKAGIKDKDVSAYVLMSEVEKVRGEKDRIWKAFETLSQEYDEKIEQNERYRKILEEIIQEPKHLKPGEIDGLGRFSLIRFIDSMKNKAKSALEDK